MVGRTEKAVADATNFVAKDFGRHRCEARRGSSKERMTVGGEAKSSGRVWMHVRKEERSEGSELIDVEELSHGKRVEEK